MEKITDPVLTEEARTAYDFFRRSGFLSIGKENYSLFREYERDNTLEGASSVVLITWASAEQGLYKIINHSLCSVFFARDSTIYFIILQPKTSAEYPLQELIDTLYRLTQEAGLSALRIKCIDEALLPDWQAVTGYGIQTEYRENDSEYIFRPDEILEMTGSANAEKRRGLRKCAQFKDISLHPMTNENVPLMSVIEEAWCLHRDCSVCCSFCGCEKKAIEIMVSIFDEKIHQGLFLYQEDKPIGYAVGEKREGQPAMLYFGKATISDFFVYLIYAMVEKHFSNSPLFNMAEDMGNQGLRFFKRHLGTYTHWRRYICTFTRQAT
jgi:hypothetical protein